MITNIKQKYFADRYLKHLRDNNGIDPGNHTFDIPPRDFDNIRMELTDNGIIKKVLPQGAALTPAGFKFKGYLFSPKQYEDYPKLMQAFTMHMTQNFENPDFENIVHGEDEERNFRSNHSNKNIFSFSEIPESIEQPTQSSVTMFSGGIHNHSSTVIGDQQSVSESSFQNTSEAAPSKAPIMSKIIVGIIIGLAVIIIGHFVFHIG